MSADKPVVVQDEVTTPSQSFPQCVPVLEGDNIVLRAHDYADLDGIVEQSNDPQSQLFIPLPNPYGTEQAKEFLAQFVEAGWLEGKRFEFAIDELTDSGPMYCGNVGVWPHSADRWEIGWVLHPSARGRGIMTKAAKRVLTWVFEERGAAVVLWRADDANKGSWRVAQRLGFEHKVVLENWLPMRGGLQDCAQATLTRAQWDQKQKWTQKQ